MSVLEIERQARSLARDNRQDDPDIVNIYWFPDDTEVRLVEVLPTVSASDDDTLQPFFFRPAPEHDLPAPSGIALIRPEEARNVRLPKNWGDWESAVSLEPEQ